MTTLRKSITGERALESLADERNLSIYQIGMRVLRVVGNVIFWKAIFCTLTILLDPQSFSMEERKEKEKRKIK